MDGRRVRIRNSTENDFERVLPLLQQLWPEQTLDKTRLRRIYRRKLESPTQRNLCATEGGRLVGFATMTLENSLWVEGCLATVDELVVDSTCRGRGIGTRLLEAMVDLARTAGAQRVELDSAHHRRAAHAFYRQRGFKNRGLVFSKPLA